MQGQNTHNGVLGYILSELYRGCMGLYQVDTDVPSFLASTATGLSRSQQ